MHLPAYPSSLYLHSTQIETEGLAKVAKKAGFEVVGVPGLLAFHAQNH
jgi:hypothetical protein